MKTIIETELKNLTDYKWSGDYEIPALGEKIKVTMNGLGPATVLGYQVNDGYLGLYLLLDTIKHYLIRQGETTGLLLMYGMETTKIDLSTENSIHDESFTAANNEYSREIESTIDDMKCSTGCLLWNIDRVMNASDDFRHDRLESIKDEINNVSDYHDNLLDKIAEYCDDQAEREEKEEKEEYDCGYGDEYDD